MTAVAPYDFSPLGTLLALGALIALVPLASVWLRRRSSSTGSWTRAITLATLFLCFDLVLLGAFTRLSDSGLGCPDWPGCYGHASPLGAHAAITDAQASLPTGPVTHTKAWIEMAHRYMATAVGALIALLAGMAWWARRREGDAASPWWATLTLFWVCLQGAFGAWTVALKLYPAVVTAHLLGGMVLLALLAAQSERHRDASVARAGFTLSPGLRAGLAAVAVLGVLQIALGGWVSTNYAVLACSEFPTCQGSWWPPMNTDSAFVLQRELGRDAAGAYLPFAALTAIHMAHRLGAVVVLPAILALAWRLRLLAHPAGRRWAAVLAGMAAWQLASGLGNVLLGWPLMAAVAHTGGAAALVVALTLLVLRSSPASTRSQGANTEPIAQARSSVAHSVELA
jgi:cytochrome c oxidase assembly protein subunit 15